jgi:CIC family chloride channel protein
VFHYWFPEVVPEPSAFIIVGMACFVGGVTRAPISTLVMASEMTKGYDLLVPIMLAEVVTFTLTQRWVHYPVQVPTRKDSPAHGAEYVLDLLQHISVREVLTDNTPVACVRASTPLAQLLRQASESSQAVFPVTDEQGEVTGLVTLESVRAFFYDEDMGKLAIAADCAGPLVSVSPNDSLAVALEQFAASHCQQLPVVDGDEHQRIVGLLSYEALLQAYSQELLRRRLGEEGPASSVPPAV